MAQTAVANPPEASKSYVFSSEPRPVQNRKKYREIKPIENVNSNIMYDRRIVRGNTYASQILPTNAQPEMEKSKSKPRPQKISTQKAPTRTSITPEPVEGRKHIDVQTDNYLEELADRVPESTNETQTDVFMDRPPTPFFIPVKTGIDVDTQIYDGDLFNFDLEVEPILEVLVGKVMEQSMMEVLEEEELSSIRAHQDEFDQIRNAELAEVQRMEAAERRRFEEKERRLAQERARMAREKQMKEKVAATMYSKNYVSDLVKTVFDSLQNAGFFYDPVVKEVEKEFVPWLVRRAEYNLENMRQARTLADELISRALELGPEKRMELRRKIEEERRRKEVEEAARKAAEEEERRRLEEEEEKRKATEEEAERVDSFGEEEMSMDPDADMDDQ